MRDSGTSTRYWDNWFGTVSVIVAQGTTDRAISVLGNVVTMRAFIMPMAFQNNHLKVLLETNLANTFQHCSGTSFPTFSTGMITNSFFGNG